jgi:hypothetical protein
MEKDIVRLIATSLEGFLEALMLESERFKMSVIATGNDFILCEGKPNDALLFIRASQTARNIMAYFGTISSEMERIEVNPIILEHIIRAKMTFKVYPDAAEKDECKKIGILIEDKLGVKADMEGNDISIGLLRSDNYYLGIHSYAKEFAKRDYRVYPSRQAATPLLYASLLELSRVKSNLDFVDPLCQDGTFGIEYALRSTREVRKHEEHLLQKDIIGLIVNNISSSNERLAIRQKMFCSDEQMSSLAKAKQNSRLAGVERSISFGRVPLQYLPLKHEKQSIGLIASKLPLVSKNFPIQKYDLMISRLLKSASIILRKGHSIILISNENELLKKRMGEYGLEIVSEYGYSKGDSWLCGIVGRKGV